MSDTSVHLSQAECAVHQFHGCILSDPFSFDRFEFCAECIAQRQRHSRGCPTTVCRGDQGFLNEHFSDFASSPVYDPSKEYSENDHKSMMLPTNYNADIGLYVFNSNRWLLKGQLKVVHYTLGSFKPWSWWCGWLIEEQVRWSVCFPSVTLLYNVTRSCSWGQQTVYKLLSLTSCAAEIPYEVRTRRVRTKAWHHSSRSVCSVMDASLPTHFTGLSCTRIVPGLASISCTCVQMGSQHLSKKPKPHIEYHSRICMSRIECFACLVCDPSFRALLHHLAAYSSFTQHMKGLYATCPHACILHANRCR
jgi:hypothetical protein